MEDYRMGSHVESWRGSGAKAITFVVTEDCNLVCKYCYITGKDKSNRMNLDLARAAVDFILNSSPVAMPENSVIWNFAGGEPLLEIELIDQITDYIKFRTHELFHRWFGNYRFSLSSNGALYDSPPVQEYIRKNHNHVIVGLSVDGNQIKHDQQRAKPDGSGVPAECVRNVPLWLKQFPHGSFQVTFSANGLKYLKDSIISLWDLGIKDVHANVVFQNVWKPDDAFLFEMQLMELADYIIDNELWGSHNCSLFSDTIGYPLTEEQVRQNSCRFGAGKTLAIDYQGNLYPCLRFVEYPLNRRSGYAIGSVYEGLDHHKLMAFQELNAISQSSQTCLACQVASGCAWCQGFNCDVAATDTVFERSTYICKMHKARVQANDYYWAKLRAKSQITKANSNGRKKHSSVKL